MKVHEQEMSSPLFESVENLKPVIQKGVSDSAALDNVFELLNKAGKPAPLAKLMLVPDAWSKKNKTLPRNHQQLFNFLNSTMEPWDGPAAIAATDNEWVIAANDRNGLRPLRYATTKDKLLFVGSETGMVELNEKKIISKGRLGPGEIIGVRIDKGKVFSNKDIKDYLAKEFKHFNSQIIDLDDKLRISNEKNNFEGEALRRRQYSFGISLEDLELILHPMAEDAKEATGSMGDDTPLAVLSDNTARGVSSPIEPVASFASSAIGCKISSRSSKLIPKVYCLLLKLSPSKLCFSLEIVNFSSKSIIWELKCLNSFAK